MRALSKQLTQKWPEALWRLGQRAWAPFSRDTATRLRLPLSGACHPGTVYLVGAGSGDVGVEYQPGIRCTPHSNSICSDPASDPQLLADAVHAARTASQVVIVSAVSATLTVGGL